MNFIARLRGSPAFLAIKARHEFEPSYPASLDRWSQLDWATAWCELRWRKHGRPYRRYVRAAEQSAKFKFSSPMDALAFRLAGKTGYRPAKAQ